MKRSMATMLGCGLMTVLASSSFAKGVGSATADYAATRQYYESLIHTPAIPMAELNMLMNMMPKGGDLHHHYSGALYAETYLEWMDKLGYCVYQQDDGSHRKFTIETVNVEAAVASGHCLRTNAVLNDNGFYRELLMRWSDKDFDNHSHESAPPDKQFFDTFGYFGPASNYGPNEGLRLLKERAKADNLQYIETMFKHAGGVRNPTLEDAINKLAANASDKDIDQALEVFAKFLDQDAGSQKLVADFRADMEADARGIDDANFTMRFQTYVVRVIPPGQVFSGLYLAFAAANNNPLLVGVNIVAPENAYVSMRDYQLHMKMFRFLKKRFPALHLDLHAGELALGMVPPEGLRDHIRTAITIAGAERIGHGVDVTNEEQPEQLLALMREKKIPVEINLSSNAFILGVKGDEHPILTYMRHHVPFVIATDDAGVSRSSIGHEYVLFTSTYRPNYDMLKQTVYNSIRYSFLSDKDKAEETRRLDARFAAFEASVHRLADSSQIKSH